MKVLIADKFEKSGIDGLNALGAEVISNPDLKEDALREALKETGAQVLIVRSTKVTADMLDAPELKLIIRAGAGYNTIDVATATEKGIYVTNCPGKNAQAVAEIAFGLMLACDRRIPENVQQLREGKWNKKEFGKAKGLCGRTLGLIGMGNIGQEMVTRAQAFGMNVLVFSSWMSDDEAAKWKVQRVDSLEDLAKRSDVVSVHTAYSPDKKGMLGEAFFSAMQPNSIFINTSRAEVVDQSAMLKAAEEKGIRLGLDVFEGEPSVAEGPYEGVLQTCNAAYCTHHIGASTDQAQDAVASEVVRIVDQYMKDGSALNAVNEPKVAASA